MKLTQIHVHVNNCCPIIRHIKLMRNFCLNFWREEEESGHSIAAQLDQTQILNNSMEKKANQFDRIVVGKISPGGKSSIQSII